MVVDQAEQLRVVERFMAAVTTGDVQGLMNVLAPDVVAISDGGGVVPAARRPIVGAEKLAAVLPRFADFGPFSMHAVWLNGLPAIRVDLEAGTVALNLVVADGRITHLYAINNPHKLGAMETIIPLER